MPTSSPSGILLSALRKTLIETLRYRPVVWLTLSLIAGIVLADQWLPRLFVWLIAGGIALILAAASLSRYAQWLRAEGCLALLALCVGGGLHAARLTPGANDISGEIGQCKVAVRGVIVGEPRHGAHWTHLLLRVTSVDRASANGLANVLLNTRQALPPGTQVQLAEAIIQPLLRQSSQGCADRSKMAWRQGIHASIKAAGATVLLGPPQSIWSDLSEWLRARSVASLQRAMPGPDAEENANLLAAMVVGAAAAQLPEQTVDEFRRTGTVHLLVVSGAQVTMLIGTVLLLASAGCRHPRWWHFLPIVPLLALLIAAAGPGVSVLRAVIMGGLWCAAVLARRTYDVATSIALAAFVLCVSDTSIVFAAGAQLTFAATTGVVLMLPRAERDDLDRLQHPPTWTAIVSGAAGAWLFTMPLLAFHFGTFPTLAGFANLIAVPMSLLIMPLGMLTICLGLIDWAAAIPGCWLCRLLLDILLTTNAWFGSLPYACVDGVRFPLWACVCWYVGAFGVVALVRTRVTHLWWRRIAPVWAIIGVGAVIALLLMSWITGGAAAGKQLTVSVLSVGNGQCVVASSPGGSVIIDAGSTSETQGLGENAARSAIMPYLRRHHVAALQAVVVSHGHADHCSAVPEILRSWDVSGLWLPAGLSGAQLNRMVQGISPQRRLTWLRAGDRCRQLGLQVIGPLRQYTGKNAATENDNSLVITLQYGGKRFLLPADAQLQAQEDLVLAAQQRRVDLQADVLIAPHHGRESATCAAFLQAVHPRYVVISTASPHGDEDSVSPRFMQIAHDLGARVLRTDEAGTVTFRTDGERLEIAMQKPGPQ